MVFQGTYEDALLFSPCFTRRFLWTACGPKYGKDGQGVVRAPWRARRRFGAPGLACDVRGGDGWAAGDRLCEQRDRAHAWPGDDNREMTLLRTTGVWWSARGGDAGLSFESLNVWNHAQYANPGTGVGRQAMV